MRRELSDESVAYQAQQLAAYAGKRGVSPAMALHEWARTKGLRMVDRRAILRAAVLAQSDEIIR